MKYKHLYAVATLSSISVSLYLLNKKNLFLDGVSVNLISEFMGSVTALVLIPALVAGLFTLGSKMLRQNLTISGHSTVFSLVWIFLVWANITVTAYEGEGPSTGGSKKAVYKQPGCEYSVEFPGVPVETKGFTPGIGTITTAEYKYGPQDPTFLRVECIVSAEIASAMRSQDNIISTLKPYARANGLSNEYFHFGDGELGLWGSLRGYKEFDGIPVTYEAFLYVGDRSSLMLYVGGLSSTYPQSGISMFLHSIKKD